jgi:hypothetical protein
LHEKTKQYYDDKFRNFALVMQENRDWNTAEVLHNQMIEMRKKLLGPEHPHSLSSRGNLASTYSKQERWNEAEQLQLQMMDMRKKIIWSRTSRHSLKHGTFSKHLL